MTVPTNNERVLPRTLSEATQRHRLARQSKTPRESIGGAPFERPPLRERVIAAVRRFLWG